MFSNMPRGIFMTLSSVCLFGVKICIWSASSVSASATATQKCVVLYKNDPSQSSIMIH